MMAVQTSSKAWAISDSAVRWIARCPDHPHARRTKQLPPHLVAAASVTSTVLRPSPVTTMAALARLAPVGHNHQLFTPAQQAHLRLHDKGVSLDRGWSPLTMSARPSPEGGVSYSPSARTSTSAVSRPEKFCWPVMRLPSRVAKLRHKPAWI